jgi:catechol 2,3-dioxygenase-like lactoylglutathione lyase family enzyme
VSEHPELAFAGMGVHDIDRARDFYERLLGRPPDVLVHADEVMWQVAASAWLFVRRDPERAGGGIVMLSVPDLEVALSHMEDRGLPRPAVETVSGNDKVTLADPDGNEVSIAQLNL